MTRWEDEEYVKLYTHPSPSFLAMSILARGTFDELMKVVDRAGMLRCGKLGLRAIAVAVRAPWAEIERAVQEMLDDGCVQYHEDRAVVLIPNYLAAQSASQSDRARKRKSRQVARALFGGSSDASERARAVTRRDRTVHFRDSAGDVMPDADVTDRDQTVTTGHAVSNVPEEGSATVAEGTVTNADDEVTFRDFMPSRDVTEPSRFVTIRGEEKRSEKRDQTPPYPQTAEAEGGKGIRESDRESDEGITPIRSMTVGREAAELYAEVAKDVLGAYALPRFAERETTSAINAHAPPGLSWRELAGRLRRSVQAYIEERRENPTREAGFHPKKWLDWLNAGNGGSLAKPLGPAPSSRPPIARVAREPASDPAEVAAARDRALAAVAGVGRGGIAHAALRPDHE